MYLNFITFAMVTVVFFGIPAAFLDVYIIVFAAGFLVPNRSLPELRASRRN
jgi:hypothetical protein